MSLVFVVALVLLLFVVGSALAICRHIGILPMKKTPLCNPIVKCEACGKMYHEDWGEFCPDCTGAD